MNIYCLSSVMVHPSSHKTPFDIKAAVCIFGKILICLTCLLIPGTWSVAMCIDSIVPLSGSLAFIYFYIITGATVGLACSAGCIFSPTSVIASMLLLV